ncbi:protein-methionine-sulfoxide reductase catalytic subunit MsrP [Thalassotalea psychrophila]|uniref:Protein-methionine-sulfoxide reductase catalytic subunit MsrP n=1 Tax=Thalassotalea psychrophila TaxID=3065647 RepID=A0ABY9TRI9_9GAMM|nr:protein-methionine-sulfoxide reductase catalytic subunit MsrP [Colwelliaceae bacterium SQ149]
MLIKSKNKSALLESQVTDEAIYKDRRKVLKQLGFVGASALVAGSMPKIAWAESPSAFKTKALNFKKSQYSDIPDKLTPEKKVISHNNFYEFGAKKDQPAELAQNFKVDPWQLKITGEVDKPFTLDYNELFSRFAIEERIYRLRCVEAWSMVIPWLGFRLADVIKKAQPNSKAKYVAFKTLHDPEQMPGQSNRYLGGGIKYPYVEGLRIDEAMNDLTLLSVGLYGKTLPAQNGAPIRLVTPWKYGFKSIKSIVEIKLVERMPKTTWNKLAPNEYGFYANVNPEVDHPRWSQASERRITSGGLFARNRIETQMFNGYGEEVADLYKGMNLGKHY